MEYILSQIFVIITYVLLGASYFTKNRQSLLFFSIAAILTNATSYFFLSAWTGLLTTAIALVRNIVFLMQNKSPYDKINWLDWIILFVFVSLLGVTAVVFYDGLLSLFSVFSSLTYTISVWQRNEKAYKILGIVSSVCSLVYFAFIKSIFGFALEFVMLLTIIVGFIKYLNDETQNRLKKTNN